VSSPFDVPDPPKPHELLSDYVEHLKAKTEESAAEAEEWKRLLKPLQEQVIAMRRAGDNLVQLVEGYIEGMEGVVIDCIRADIETWEKVKE